MGVQGQHTGAPGPPLTTTGVFEVISKSTRRARDHAAGSSWTHWVPKNTTRNRFKTHSGGEDRVPKHNPPRGHGHEQKFLMSIGLASSTRGVKRSALRVVTHENAEA